LGYAKKRGGFMKKTIIWFLLFLSVSLCFAKGVLDDDKEFGIGYYGFIHTATRDYTAINSNTYDRENTTGDITNAASAFAINATFTKYYTESFGMVFFQNIFLLKETIITEHGESSKNEINGTGVGIDYLIGPIFKLYENEKTAVSLATGIHLNFLFFFIYDGNNDILSLQTGLGASITDEYSLADGLYVYARFQLYYDFYSYEISGGGGGRGFGFISAWNISPCVGIGFKSDFSIFSLLFNREKTDE
jgi:hypothetical protein